MKITKQQFDELRLRARNFRRIKNASDLEQVLKAVGIDDDYWLVHSDGSYLASTWSNHPIDIVRLSLGNVHRTKEDAEHYKATTLRRWQAEIAIRRWREVVK